MIWRIGDLPELQSLDPDDRQRALQRLPRCTYPKLAVCSAIGAALATSMAWRVLGVGTTLNIAIVIAVSTVSLGSIYRTLLWMIQIFLRGELVTRCSGRVLPVCLRCGYDLRGTTGARPECDAPIIVPARCESAAP